MTRTGIYASAHLYERLARMSLSSLPGSVASPPTMQVETNGINVIPEDERHGTPRSLFWPWATSSISLFNVSIAALLTAFGMDFIPTAVAAALGIIASFFLVGQISLAGKRASAPTMVISRTAFGMRGNAVPTFISYLTLIGWEIITVVTTVMAANTVFARLGWAHGGAVEAVVFIIVVGVVVVAGVFGFRLVTRFQGVVTVASIAMISCFVALTIGNVNWSALGRVDGFTPAGFIGTLVVAAAAFGIGWTNSGADYSRYLPRGSSGKAIVAWTTFAGSLMPIVLVVYGLMLVTSDPGLIGELGDNPIGTLVSLLPTSALILLPFLLVMSLGTTGSGAMDLYSSGLTLLTLGLRVPRAGVFIADATCRRDDYSSADLFNVRGRYGLVGWPALGSMIVGTLVGWGLVTSDTSATLLAWQGFIFDLPGVAPESTWRDSDLGVIAALVIGFVGTWALGRARVRRQEAAV